MEKTINKVVRIGSYVHEGKISANVFCNIKYDGKNLSITGVEGPLSNGDCRGSCGQIGSGLEALKMNKYAPGWDREKLIEFAKIWARWHLNDLTAGNPSQEQYIRDYRSDGSYNETLAQLETAGLSPDPDTGYVYGNKWLFEAVPTSIISWLAALPDTDKKPAWV